MHLPQWAPALLTLAMGGPASAADLATLSRHIAKEPAYESKSPRYCLLLFGQEAEHRLWMVRDGDVLYVDKNGNGDLTEAGERIEGRGQDSGVVFHVGAIRAGKLEHRNLIVKAVPLAPYKPTGSVGRAALKKDRAVSLMSVSAAVEMPGRKGDGEGGRVSFSARADANGPLLFSHSREEAPVLHFGGPLHLRADSAQPRLLRNVVQEWTFNVGTPGIGPGTFAAASYEGLIPAEAFVLVEAEFSPPAPGAPPIKQKFELKERC